MRVIFEAMRALFADLVAAAAELFSADAVMITSTTKLKKICDNINGKALEASGRDTVKSLFNELKRDFLEKTAKIR